MDKKVDIIKDADGKSIVVINDLRFNVSFNIFAAFFIRCSFMCAAREVP